MKWTRWVEWLALLFAILGGIILMLLALMTIVSVIGRAFFSWPIPGDIELSQQGIAIAIASFLPYCLFTGGSLIIDFFTTRASERTRRWLDTLGALTLAFVMGLFAWRTSIGILDARESGETTMVVAFPLWITYAAMAPAFLVAALSALALAANTFTGHHNSEGAAQ